MSRLYELGVLDIRDRLPRGTRPQTTGIRPAMSGTIHYNGPPVALADSARTTTEQWIQHFRGIAQYHVSKVWGTDRFGRPLYGHGIMYHAAALPDGTLVQLRDWDAELWHCANPSGNLSSIALHFAVGGAQDVTDAQWSAGTRFFEALGYDLGWPGRTVVFGHREWRRLDGVTQSPCPGPLLMKRLDLWRRRVEPSALRRFRVAVPRARVRQGPGTTFPVALGGMAVLPRGYEFDAHTITPGEVIAGSPDWAHMAGGLGFVHTSLLEAA